MKRSLTIKRLYTTVESCEEEDDEVILSSRCGSDEYRQITFAKPM